MELYKDTLNRVTDWLKFAEAKNALLAAASGASTWAAVRILGSDSVCGWPKIYFYVLLACVASSLALSLASLLPITKYLPLLIGRRPEKHENHIYFGHLAHYRTSTLIEAIDACHPESAELSDTLKRCFAEQIIINSRIAVAKYRVFNIALIIMLSGIITPVLAILLIFIIQWKGRIDG